MKKSKITIGLTSSLIVASTLALTPIGAYAEWRQDSNGWWNSEGNSWSVGWKEIDKEWYYFDKNGYMRTGWVQDGGKWYYLYSSGAMAKNVTINGYVLDSNGTWIQTVQNSTEQGASTKNSLPIINPEASTISGVTGIKFEDVTKIVFYDGRGFNKPVTVEDKQKVKEFMEYLDGYRIKEGKNPESVGWIHSASFFINDKEVMKITFANPIIINGNYFNIIKGDLDTEKISKFLKSVDHSYDMVAGLE